jgi:glucose/arabinose dehydrogenase
MRESFKGKLMTKGWVKPLHILWSAVLLGFYLPVSLASAEDFTVTTVAEGLDFPWSLAFLPDGSMLVTERSGQLRRVTDGQVSDPISGVPEVYARSQGGLFDVVLHPDFANNNTVYLTYAGGTRKSNATHLARAQLVGNDLENFEVLFVVDRKKDTAAHFGGRLAFLKDGTMLLTTGDGFDYREQAQNLGNHLGSTIRLNDDGSVPDDNPFVGQEAVQSEIWTYGHRSPQGLTVDPATGTVYETEHGPKGGDEVNILIAGNNYGWPVITYGRDYSGARISPFTEMDGLEQPLVDWTPSIAPSGLALYTGDLFPKWKGDLFAGALLERTVHRIDLEDGAVIGQEILLEELGERIRDVRDGPDGYIYILTDSPEGRILRLEPKN